MQKSTTIGIMGIGEVGSALESIFKKKYKVFKKDFDFDQIKNNKLEILHVCIPYSENFTRSVISQAKLNKPKLIIIHSTVKPGTTEKIFKKSKILSVHSPVMGTHPNLKKDILRFYKFIGPVNEKSAILAKKHFQKLDIKVILLKNSLESEVGKLLDTTYYAWNIIFCKLVGKICKEQKLDFGRVYTEFNRVYNFGYRQSKPNVLRPILKYEDGPVGGHCVIPNATLLDDYIKTPLTSFLLDVNKKLGAK